MEKKNFRVKFGSKIKYKLEEGSEVDKFHLFCDSHVRLQNQKSVGVKWREEGSKTDFRM